MSTYTIKEIFAERAAIGSEVVVQGWVRTRRDSKAGFSFIHVSDGSCFQPIQVVAPNTLSNYQQDILMLTAGCSLRVTGELTPSPAKGQPFEVKANKVEVLGWVENPETYPISPKAHSLEYLREVAHLRPRTNTIGAATRIRHVVARAIHEFFDKQGFFWISTPIITASDCEGAGELFRVSTLDLMNLPKAPNGQVDFSKDFFGKETFLTVSGQLNLEAYCLALSKVYTFGPAFRSENSHTSRHLAEFWMVEPEIAFADLMANATLAEAMLKYVFTEVLNRSADDMAFFQERVDSDCIKRLEKFVAEPFAIVDYSEAIELLQKSGQTFDYPVEWGLDLQSEHERYLAETVIGRPVVIINFPAAIKAFYMKLNDDGKTVAAMDILTPGIGEIIGGSERECRLDVITQRMLDHGLDIKQYEWYLDLRRYGTVPHSGFGLGFERLLNYITGLNNIRDVIAFPRAPGNIMF